MLAAILCSAAGQKNTRATLHILIQMKYVRLDLRWQEGKEDGISHSSYTYEGINRHSTVPRTLKDEQQRTYGNSFR